MRHASKLPENVKKLILDKFDNEVLVTTRYDDSGDRIIATISDVDGGNKSVIRVKRYVPFSFGSDEMVVKYIADIIIDNILYDISLCVKRMSNSHGGLVVSKAYGKFFWVVTCDGSDYEWIRISETLYSEIIKYNEG